MGFYHWENWPDFFQVSFHRLPERELVPVLEREAFRIFASPVRHTIPTVGLRIESNAGSQVLAYSCDTEPAPTVVGLAAGADVLIHEASGAGVGHSSAAQAAHIAKEAEVGRLILIHYPTDSSQADLVAEARRSFPGEVELAQDLMEIEL